MPGVKLYCQYVGFVGGNQRLSRLSYQRLPGGSHKIRLSKDRYSYYEETVDVQWNKNIKCDIIINAIMETPTKIERSKSRIFRHIR
jgi:hypothetical protein